MKTLRLIIWLALAGIMSHCSKNDDNNPTPPTNLYPVSFTASWGAHYTFSYNADKKISRIQLFEPAGFLRNEASVTYTNGHLSAKTTTYYASDGSSSTRQETFTHNSSGRLMEWTYASSSSPGVVGVYQVSYDSGTSTYTFLDDDDGSFVGSFRFSDDNQVVESSSIWNYTFATVNTRYGPFYNLKDDLLPLYFIDDFLELFFATRGLTGLTATFGANSQQFEITEAVNDSNFVNQMTTTNLSNGNSTVTTIDYTEL